MDNEKLKKCLESWMKVSTWYTSHPLDEERFNKALKNAFNTLGTSIAFENFEQAILELANECHGHNNEHFNNVAENYARRADYIASYLNDICKN